MNKKNSFGAVAGKIWSQYSFIFVFLIILVGYAFTIQANGNAFKWSHIAAVLGSQNTCIVGTMALGMALVIITGQIDLSIGSSPPPNLTEYRIRENSDKLIRMDSDQNLSKDNRFSFYSIMKDLK